MLRSSMNLFWADGCDFGIGTNVSCIPSSCIFAWSDQTGTTVDLCKDSPTSAFQLHLCFLLVEYYGGQTLVRQCR